MEIRQNVDPADEIRSRYLGDGVYASFDGYQIWLKTGYGDCNAIALEPEVFAQLCKYAKDIHRMEE